MIKVGITGGIGSGKSLVCQVFAKLGVPVYQADEESHLLTDSDPEIRKGIISMIGEQAYRHNRLNRPLLADLIFKDKQKLEQINRIIHPIVAEHFMNWCTRHTGHSYIILESALLFESNMYSSFEQIVTVVCPETIRIARVLQRPNMTLEKVHAILKNQLQEQEKIRLSHHTLLNDGSSLLLPQILTLHHVFSSSHSFQS